MTVIDDFYWVDSCANCPAHCYTCAPFTSENSCTYCPIESGKHLKIQNSGGECTENEDDGVPVNLEIYVTDYGTENSTGGINDPVKTIYTGLGIIIDTYRANPHRKI